MSDILSRVSFNSEIFTENTSATMSETEENYSSLTEKKITRKKGKVDGVASQNWHGRVIVSHIFPLICVRFHSILVGNKNIYSLIRWKHLQLPANTALMSHKRKWFDIFCLIILFPGFLVILASILHRTCLPLSSSLHLSSSTSFPLFRPLSLSPFLSLSHHHHHHHRHYYCALCPGT